MTMLMALARRRLCWVLLPPCLLARRAAVCVVGVCVSGEMHVSLGDALRLSTASLVYYSWVCLFR